MQESIGEDMECGLESMEETPVSRDIDVLIIGGGLAGLASAIRLRTIGFTVLCVEPGDLPRSRVGESLDWSSPLLLRQLGLSTEAMIASRKATYKKGITIHDNGHAPDVLLAPPWITKPPFRFNAVTVHVDRLALDASLYELAQEMGVVFLRDSVLDIECSDDRILCCKTRKHGKVCARYYIDATGRRQLFGTKLGIPKREMGVQKVCLWSYYTADRDCHGTTFYVDSQSEYLSWIWEIPITPHEISVGRVLCAREFKEAKGDATDLRETYLSLLQPFNGPWTDLECPAVEAIQACSFQSYAYTRPVGKNWVMIGEAAAFTDPLTSNGVTAALRHCHWLRDLFPSRLLSEDEDIQCPLAFSNEVIRISEFFNDSIERAVYMPEIRRAFGIGVAVRVYTIGAFFFNAIYTRYGVETPRARRIVFGFMEFSRGFISFWRFLAGAVSRLRR